MPLNSIVEAFYILKDGLSGLPACLEAAAFHTFPLQGPEKGLGHGILVPGSGAAYARGDAYFGKSGSGGITSILRAAE